VQPRVLLLDEPFSALDATVRKELRDWLRRPHDEVHATTIFVTHDQEEALEVAQQGAVINAGRIEQSGTPDDLYEHLPTRSSWASSDPPPGRATRGCARTTSTSSRTRRRARFQALSSSRPRWATGRRVAILATGQQADELELRAGQIVWVRVNRTRESAA